MYDSVYTKSTISLIFILAKLNKESTYMAYEVKDIDKLPVMLM